MVFQELKATVGLEKVLHSPHYSLSRSYERFSQETLRELQAVSRDPNKQQCCLYPASWLAATLVSMLSRLYLINANHTTTS